MQLPETIIGTAFGLVAFPTLAELAARGDQAGLRRTLGESLRTVLALAVPAASALDPAGPAAAGAALPARRVRRSRDGGGLRRAALLRPGAGGARRLELAARAFFAQQDTVTPLLAAGSAAANIRSASC